MPAAKRFEKIYLEISGVCNLRCGFCPETPREKDFMSRELFELLIGQVAPLAEQVCFHLMGEPLTHPGFADFIRRCEERNLPVNIATNGTLLSEARASALLNPVVRQVNFSVHSFASNFPGQDVGPYLENIFAFTRRAFELRPDLYINYRLWNLEGGDADKNADIVARVGRAFGVELENRADVRQGKGLRVQRRLYLNFDTRFDWPSPSAPLQSAAGTCRALSRQLGILCDGTVVPCCLDKEGVLALGDAKRRALDEILSGERADLMNRGFREGRLVEDLCRRCTFVKRFGRQAARLAAGAAR